MLANHVLIDTNVFVYATDEASPFYPAASAFLDAASEGRFVGCITPQVLLEFVSVITNPKRVATVRTADEAWTTADTIAASFTLLVPPADLFERTSKLGRTLGTRMQDVFDLAIGLTALASGVAKVCSYDAKVFSRIPGLIVESPEAVTT